MERTLPPLALPLTQQQEERFLVWCAAVEAATGTPLEGVVLSFLVTKRGDWQILVRPSTDQDFKLKNIARLDGTYDTFAPHEEVLAEYDDLGFTSIPIVWPDVGLKLYLCDGEFLGRETPPRCYVECLDDPMQPLLPFLVSVEPHLLVDDVRLRLFVYTPLAPAVVHRIEQFIRTNVDVLLQHWQGDLDSFTLLERLQPSAPGEGTR